MTGPILEFRDVDGLVSIEIVPAPAMTSRCFVRIKEGAQRVNVCNANTLVTVAISCGGTEGWHFMVVEGCVTFGNIPLPA